MSEGTKEESARALLDEDTESNEILKSSRHAGRRSPPHWVCAGLAHLAICLLYLSIGHFWILSKSIHNDRALCNRDLFPAIANSDAVSFERRPFPVHIRNNPFAGEPRPELDAAWHDLFENIRIKVSAADLAFFNLSSIPLADGSGFAAELGVHHELHCLKKIRHWIYRDYYLGNESSAELEEWKFHVYHCTEMLRESIMCRGDTSLTTFKYLPGGHLTAVANGHHQCVNWDRLMRWVRERAIPIFEPGVLVGPDKQ